MTSRVIALTAGLALVAPLVVLQPATPTETLPRLMLWAWERPVDLRGLDRNVGVAFLAQTITLGPASFVVAPRRHPLHVDPATRLVAVTRIEAPVEAPEDRALLAEIAAAIARTVEPTVHGIQIDFDARASQRGMYRMLLHEVRRALKPGTPLSMTALASWCLDDDWLHDLPIDEAVPMAFRMGPAEAPRRNALGGRLQSGRCRAALGLSLDEPLDVRRGRRRVYIFNPSPWTAATIDAARRRVQP